MNANGMFRAAAWVATKAALLRRAMQVLIVLASVSGVAKAQTVPEGACMSSYLPLTAVIPEVSVPRNLALGSPIPGAMVTVSLAVTCNKGPAAASGPAQWRWSSRNGTPIFSEVPGFTEVYRTSSMSEGVGLRVETFGGLATHYLVNGQIAFGLGDYNLNGTSNIEARFVLIKVAESPQTGTYTQPGGTGIHGVAWINNSTEANSALDVKYTIKSAQSSSCTLSQKDIEVALPKVLVNDFTGVGSFVGPTTFPIGVNCEDKVALRFEMKDATKPGNVSNILSLGAGSTAEGVGIQILDGQGKLISYTPGGQTYNQSTTPIFNPTLLGEVPAGTSSTTFTARYVQTEAV
ncbi:fimbrial protein [Pseudoxanthomonas indica]|uniref:Fimbrial protein n=1 Tax=Pseudoxanthomonas indica TaxID=428993 RepID=A0A1T5LYF3_9GAMM|nr:fimbrial protein [Pseudoxanthomonas indica]SKC80618.1 Fimbrial protein [Pseudoxanthomonas indica]